jgi:hypothetical protein
VSLRRSVLLALVVVVHTAGCGAGDPCDNELLSRVEAPGGAHVAVVFERGCGATTGSSTQVSVLRARDVFRVSPSFLRPTASGNALVLDSRHGRVAVGARWIDDARLELTYAPGATSMQAAATVDGVTIRHVRSGPPVAADEPALRRGSAPYSKAFAISLVSDSFWGHCDFSMTVDDRGAGEVRSACRDYDGPLTRAARQLNAEDVEELRPLLRSADLFGAVSEGSDGRGMDLPLVTLKVTVDGRTTEMVCFMNPDFQSEGPRKAFLDRLMRWFRETRDARVQ